MRVPWATVSQSETFVSHAASISGSKSNSHASRKHASSKNSFNPGANMCRVLSVEYSVPYLVKRHVALRRAEIAVESASSLREAMALLRLGEFDVVVLGHGIPETERDRIADTLLETKPGMRIV